ncbi:MAG: FTR1 family protein [Ghiorsea sp.]
MLSALIIVFREVLEMSMVLGMLFAATKDVFGCKRWINAGATVGLVGAVIVAVFMEALESAVDGDGEFLFNAIVLSIASVMLAWTVIWMSKHGKQMSQRIKQVGAAVAEGSTPMIGLFVVSFAAVMREGSEAVFFLFGTMQAGEDMGSILTGGILGLLAGAAMGFVLYLGLVRIPMKHVFQVMGFLLMLLAAGMASQAAVNLIIIDMLPPLIDSMWNTSAILSEESFLGSVLHVMMGYDEQPSAMQMIVFAVTFFTTFWLYRREQNK